MKGATQEGVGDAETRGRRERHKKVACIPLVLPPTNVSKKQEHLHAAAPCVVPTAAPAARQVSDWTPQSL